MDPVVASRVDTREIQWLKMRAGEVAWKKVKVKSESEVAQSCLTLCNPVDCSPPGSSIHGILQARVLEWDAIAFSRGSSRPRDRTQVFHIAGRRFNLWATREAQAPFYYALGYCKWDTERKHSGDIAAPWSLRWWLEQLKSDSNGYGWEIPSKWFPHACGWSRTVEGQYVAFPYGLYFSYHVDWLLSKNALRGVTGGYPSKTPRQKLHSPFWPSSEVICHHTCHILLIINLNNILQIDKW